ncbi:MAG TPA: hypothetical protein VNP04_18730 [Alphaproteobacteria bacterium]|nr:hypothetical protein [Alphaproteobacteria bacterium]
MEIGKTRIQAGPITFALQHRYLDGGAPHTQGAGGAGGGHADQGVCIQVVGQVGGKETELLRFDCFDHNPHYHYGPENKNVRIMLDPTLTGNPIGWTIKQLGTKLPEMLTRAGYAELAGQIDTKLVAQKLAEVETAARQMAAKERHYTRHNRGNPVIEAGNIRFGLEMRTVGPDGGPAIHVLADVADQEIELIAFDCFRVNPHYHYGPRNTNERIFMDTTLFSDSLQETLDWLKSGKLPAMIARAGYPDIAAAVDRDLVAAKLPEVESTLREMAKAASVTS